MGDVQSETKFGFNVYGTIYMRRKVGCVFTMVVVSILPQAELGPNDHREDAPHFSFYSPESSYLNPIQAIWFPNN